MRAAMIGVLGLVVGGCFADDQGQPAMAAGAGAGGANFSSVAGDRGTGGASPGAAYVGKGGASAVQLQPELGGRGGSEADRQAATLSASHPGDVGLADNPAVIFFDDFETGWGRWSAPNADTEYLTLKSDGTAAHAGSGYLQSSVTVAHLEAKEYISSQSHIDFPESIGTVYLRYYAQFVGTAPTPHHWVRMTAGTPGFNGSGRANTVPPGDEGFWFDFDASNDDRFNFYVYWYNMRSGRCNDGSAVPGCAGDQGTSYYYGNVFQPPQAPFRRDEWFCVEMMTRANDVGQNNGALAFWIDDQLVGDYREGEPSGTWLRATFHTGGCEFSACTVPAPFEGFDFRSSEAVAFKSFVLDAYYERASSADRRAQLKEAGIMPGDAQTVLYDDVVIASERIGCRVAE